MSCQVQPPSKVKFTASDGYSYPCARWLPGYPANVSYESIDYARYRSGCRSSPKINGFRKPTSYANAYCYYVTEPFDFTTFGKRRQKGRTSQGMFFGGIGSLGGMISFSNWVNQNGTCLSYAFNSALYNSTIAEATAKVADRKLNALESLAELQRSIDMIAIRAAMLAKAIRAARKGDVPGLISALKLGSKRGRGFGKTVADLWLEYQYGWKPLLSDIYGACQALNQGLRKSGAFSVKSSKSDYLATPRTRPVGYGQWEVQGGAKQFATTEYYFRIASPWLATLESLGILNPALLAWELVPFSFVIDWFVPISTWLSTLTSTLGTEFVGGYTTYGLHVTEKLVWCDFRKSEIACGTIPNGALVIKQFQRVAYTTWPESKVYIKSPFTVNRAISAIALILQHSK